MRRRIYLSLMVSASSGFQDSMFKRIFYDTLVKIGHEVVFFPYHEACLSSTKEKLTKINDISENIFQNFLKHHNQKPFDFFLSYYHGLQVVPELFTKIREILPCINYTTNFHQIENYEPLLKEANLSIYVSKEAGSYFESKGFKGYYMPFAGLSENLRSNENKNGKISFIGTSYGPRAYYLWRCLQNKLPVEIYGANWIRDHKTRAFFRSLKLQAEMLKGKKTKIDIAYNCLNDIILSEINSNYKYLIHKPLSDSNYNELLSNSSIVLNIPESRFGHNYLNHQVLIGANLRDFEVPTAGSLLVTQDNEEIRTLFDVDHEIICFNNEWEMVDKLNYYINKPVLLKKIAYAGHEKVKKEHLWEHRFIKFLSFLENTYL